MTFLSPWAAWFLAGIPVICLLYLLKVRREKRSVSALFLWERVLLENRHRALFQRLRHPLSLLLQLLIFLTLVAALAKPNLHPGALAGGATVLVLDSRARMQAIEPDGRTRFAHAIQTARSLVSNASEKNPFAIVVAGAQTRAVSGFSAHPNILAGTLKNLEPTDAGGSLSEALLLASQLSRSCTQPARILLFSDALPKSHLPENVQLIPCGRPSENLAITRLASRPLPNSPETCEILLELANFGAQPASPSVDLRLDGKLLEVKPFQLAPGQQIREFFRVPLPANRSAQGRLVATLSTSDALPLDNQAFAVLPPRPKLRVLLVSQGNWFLEKLLEANQQCSYELVSPPEFRPDLAASFDALILDTPTVPTPEALPKNTLFLQGSPWGPLGPEIAPPLFPETDPTSPLMRLVDFSTVTLLKARSISVPDSAQPWSFQSPLRHLDHPLILTAEHPENSRRIAILGFQIADSNLPLRIAFPILLNNLLQWFSLSPDSLPLQLSAGQSLELPAHHSVIRAPQKNLQNPPIPAPLHPREIPAQTRPERVFLPLQAGFYEIQSGTAIRQLAVNLFSKDESKLSGTDPGSGRPMPGFSTQLPAPANANPSHWLLTVALFLSLVEWHLFHRRRIE
ncbi:MAG: hypothetical protein RLZZ253_629 [Verrucomicrobiota bacterium]|jgi:hypothetical protein